MANSGAARPWPCMQRALQTCQGRTGFAPVHRPLLANSAAAVQHPLPSQQVSHLSTTSSLYKRRANRDHNRHRGLSVIRRTGTREVLSVHNEPLPQPVSPEDFPKVQTDPEHGLWDFFYSKDSPLNTPEQDLAHGRAWKVEELRRKSWDELHKLWWVCVKERNRIATGNRERVQGRYGYGESESHSREIEVRKTQAAIKHTLIERFYAWEDARKLAENDPEINLQPGGRPAYAPHGSYVEDGKMPEGYGEGGERAGAEKEAADTPIELGKDGPEKHGNTSKEAVGLSIPPNPVRRQQEAPIA